MNVTFEEVQKIYKSHGFIKSRKTVLYAPTFFPSSIEKMAKDFPRQFKECNVIVKPHYLTYALKKYAKQREQLAAWAKFDNCFVMDEKEYSLLPFILVSDVMISDESSAMFEFSGLNKPVVSNRYFKLRLSYYLFPWKLKKRIDKKKDKYRNVLLPANSYNETIEQAKKGLYFKSILKKERETFIKDIFGTVDGKVSERIANLLDSVK